MAKSNKMFLLITQTIMTPSCPFYVGEKEIYTPKDPLNELFTNWPDWLDHVYTRLYTVGVICQEDGKMEFEDRNRVEIDKLGNKQTVATFLRYSLSSNLMSEVDNYLETNSKSRHDPGEVWAAIVYIRMHPCLRKMVGMTIVENYFDRFIPHGLEHLYMDSLTDAYEERLQSLSPSQITALLKLAKIRRDSPEIYSRLIGALQEQVELPNNREIPGINVVNKYLFAICSRYEQDWQKDMKFQESTSLPFNMKYFDKHLRLVPEYMTQKETEKERIVSTMTIFSRLD